MYDAILLSYEKEQKCAICRDMDGPRHFIQTKVIQKEKNKYCMLTYMWNIEKWYR